MPLYEYKCDSCGATFEVIQRFSDPPVKECRVCGQPVQKVLSAPAIQFKGSGWYVTDYAKKGKSEPDKSTGTSTAATADASPSKDSSSKDSSSTDSTSTDSAPKPAKETTTAASAEKK